MSLSLLLAVLTAAIAVAVMGMLTALTAMAPQARGRGWLMASLGVAIGVAVCAQWHNVAAGRLIALVLVSQGWIIFEKSRRRTAGDLSSSVELTAERLP